MLVVVVMGMHTTRSSLLDNFARMQTAIMLLTTMIMFMINRFCRYQLHNDWLLNFAYTPMNHKMVNAE
jgi:hypothetical protein